MSDSDTATLENDKIEAAKKITAKIEEMSEEEKPDLPVETPIDDIEQNVPHKLWKFEGDVEVFENEELVKKHFERQYTQKPLAYHTFLQFGGELTNILDDIMKGPDGVGVDSLISMLTDDDSPIIYRDGKLSVDNSKKIDGFDMILRSMLKLFSHFPQFVLNAQCIWLGIPRREREFMKEFWSRSKDEGGLSIQDGEEMLSLFIEQNYEDIEYFLKKYWRGIGKAIQRAKTRKKMKAI